MTMKPIGSLEVRPNTLHDQTIPNTLRGVSAPGRRAPAGPAPRARSAAAQRRRTRLTVPPWVYVAAMLLVLFLALYLLHETP